MRVYLAGPMSGLPQFNFPAFYEAAKNVRAIGMDVVSPAELDDAEDQGAALKSATGDPKEASRSWGDFLARDVKLIADGGIKGIVFLPDWFKSRGARLEASVGLLQKDFKFFTCGWDFYRDSFSLTEIQRNVVAYKLYEQNLEAS